MTGDLDDVDLQVRMRFDDREFAQSYRFPRGHLELLRRPRNPLEIHESDPRDVWDFSRRLEMRKQIIDMIAINIAASIAVAFDKEFER